VPYLASLKKSAIYIQGVPPILSGTPCKKKLQETTKNYADMKRKKNRN